MNLRRFAHRLLLKHPEPDRSNKMVAILLKGRRIVAYGYNSEKTHPLGKKITEYHDLYCSGKTHAEVAALSRGRSGDRIFVARVKADGSFGLARPCPVCQLILKQQGVKHAIYTVDSVRVIKEEIL